MKVHGGTHNGERTAGISKNNADVLIGKDLKNSGISERNLKNSEAGENSGTSAIKTIFAGNLNLCGDNTSEIEEKRKKAQKIALQLMSNVFDSDIEIDEETDKHNQNAERLFDLNAEHREKLNDIEREQENLLELYGEGAEKSQEYTELEKIKYEFYKMIDDNTLEMRKENSIVSGIKIERLKSHEMVDAKKQGDAVISAANKEIIGLVAQQAKENIDKRAEETKDEKERLKEEKERLEEQIKAAKAEKSQSEEKDDLDEMYEIGSALDDIKKSENSDNNPDIKKSLTQIVNELKLTAEDLKGAVVDDNV